MIMQLMGGGHNVSLERSLEWYNFPYPSGKGAIIFRDETHPDEDLDEQRSGSGAAEACPG